jgi:hypothetical protein
MCITALSHTKVACDCLVDTYVQHQFVLVHRIFPIISMQVLILRVLMLLHYITLSITTATAATDRRISRAASTAVEAA